MGGGELKFQRYGNGIVKGMAVTIRYLLRHPVTTQYPEQRLTTSRRLRGNELVWTEARCTGCSTCAKACPQGAILIVTAQSGDRLTVEKYEVDTGYCIQCGLCVEVCPYEALRMGYSYERAKYRRGELVQRDDELAASADRPASGYMYPDEAAKLPPQTLLVDRDDKD